MDTTDTNGDTPIHASLLYHNFENTKLLLEYNADLELTNDKARKPIHFANDTESLELLLDHGADIDARDGNGKIFISINKTLCMHIFLPASTLSSPLVWSLREPRDD